MGSRKRSSSKTEETAEAKIDPAEVIANVRKYSGVAANAGPSDAQIVQAVTCFVQKFDYWYIRVMKKAIPSYRVVLVQRINPFIRRIQYDGASLDVFVAGIVHDYEARNFVTAGGWALEQLAININPHARKSAARGIDFERVDPANMERHLYVLKSGLVTRNSDIIDALKKNARAAEKLLRQDQGKERITVNYAIAAGRTNETFEDGVRRPASAGLWSELTLLPTVQAVDLVLSVAMEAGRLIRSDASIHIAALQAMLAAYLRHPDQPTQVDWEFLKIRNFRPRSEWKASDQSRHKAALSALEALNYPQTKKVARAAEKQDQLPEEVLQEQAFEESEPQAAAGA